MKGLLKTMLAAVTAATAFTITAPYAMAQDGAQANPVIKIHTGKYYDWYTDQETWKSMKDSISPDFAIFDNSVDQLLKDWGTAPPTTHLYCYIDASGKNGAYATGDISQVDASRGASPSPGIGINANLFEAKGYGVAGGTAIVFGVHEMVNDMTGQVSAGWPRDWWADDRSPFPGMTEIHLLNELGYTDIAKADDLDLSKDPLYVMFKGIQSKYGWGVFSRMFTNMRTNHVDWTQIDGGHNPSAVMTNLVCAYMTLGSADTAANMDKLFTTGPVPGYSLTAVQAVLNTLGYGGPLPANGDYTLTEVGSGLVVDGSATAGDVAFAKMGGIPEEKWTFTSAGDGVYTIKSAKTGLAIDAGGNKKGTIVKLKPAKAGDGQTWLISSTASGYVITNKKSGLALETSAKGTSNSLQLMPSTDTAAQKWIIH